MLKAASQGIENIGQCILLFKEAMSHVSSLPRQWKRVVEQAFVIGYLTFPIVGILSFFIGAVLALQTGFSLKDLAGTQQFLGNIVGLSLARELGPVMTSFLLAGRVGSAMAAELGSMKAYNEIDALNTMQIPPAKLLVLPRLVATALMMPILTAFSIIIGWFGGMAVVEYVDFIQIDSQIYWRALKTLVDFKSFRDGLIKAEIFGVLITLIACNQGLVTRGGPREIGNAVTAAVVKGMIAILFLDYFVTKMLL